MSFIDACLLVLGFLFSSLWLLGSSHKPPHAGFLGLRFGRLSCELHRRYYSHMLYVLCKF